MSELFIISDIAGQYSALKRLLKHKPKDAIVVSVGDIVDRGPKSYEVVKYFMNNPKHIVLLGNHEDMMLDAIIHGNYYQYNTWFYNGGGCTSDSFELNGVDLFSPSHNKPYIEWLKARPLKYETDNIFISHAFFGHWMKGRLDLKNYNYHLNASIIWNRQPPEPMVAKYQVCGHNSQYGLKTWYDDDGEPYATCLDDSRKNVLTAMHWPSMRIFQEHY